MKNTFSNRYGYDPSSSGSARLEEAPLWLRICYCKSILEPLIFVDQDERYRNIESKPIGAKALAEKIYYLIKQETDDSIYDSFYCIDLLKDLIKSIEWYHFFDVVEIVGKEVIKADNFSKTEKKIFDYIAKVNHIFAENNIGWRINKECNLHREIPKLLNDGLQNTESTLNNEFAPARLHYIKARNFIYERPIDPENAIKEIISAIESAGRVIYPKASTLGDVIKLARKDDQIPKLMLDVIDKFYIFSNATPAIRHGSPKSSTLSLQDAELCLHIGVALIRYIIDKQRHTS